MNEIRKQIRISRAVQVITLTQDGLSISAACREVGIPRSTYYLILDTETEALLEYQKIIRVNDRLELLRILAIRDEVLEKLIEKAFDDDTEIKEMLAIHKELQKRFDVLSAKVREEAMTSKFTKDFLKGPQTVIAKSTWQENHQAE